MRFWRLMLLVALAGASVAAEAQVHKCVDASGKATFSDIPCPTSAKSSGQVLGREATERRIEPEDAGYRRNMESINRSRAALQGSVNIVTRQSQTPEGSGAAILDGPPNQQVRSTLQGSGGDDCETTSTRKGCIGGSRSSNPNWSARRGYYGGGGAADQQYEMEQERLRQAAAAKAAQPPAMLTNCNASGCWDNQGNRYNSTGDGSRFVNSEGRTCRANGRFVSCN